MTAFEAEHAGPEAAAPAPAPAPEPAVLRKPVPARAGDRSLDGEREQLVKKAAALMDTQYTEREVDGFGREIERTLAQRPELGSQELEETLWRGLLAFSKYVDELRRNNHQMEDIALDKSEAEVRPAARFREFYRLYRALLAARPDLAPSEPRAKLAQALTLGHVASGRNNYYYNLNADGTQALEWVWRQMVETAFSLSEERPDLVSAEWLERQLAADARWPAYSLERRSARLKDAALSDAAATELANELAQALAKDPKRATERLTRDLYEAMDSVRDAAVVPERGAAAARLALALAEVRPELADARVTELLKRWLTPGAVPGAAGEWLGAQAVELGLMLERKRSGRSPWKEMEARLKDDPRWTQLVLIRHASVLADETSTAEAAIEAANELTKALAERPQDATPELGERLWAALERHLAVLRADRRGPIEPAVVTLVGGRALPVRRAREAFELYRKLLDARPDLAPAELPARLEKQLAADRVRQWRPSSYEGFFRNDPRAGEAVQWANKQLEDLALSVSAKRPELLTMPDMLKLYTQSVKHLGESHSFSLWGVWALVVGGIWTGLFPILRFGNDVMVPLWAWWLAAAPIGAHLAFNTVRWLRERPAYAAMAARLREETLRRMRAQAPIDTLRLIASFDQERGRWVPNAGRAELFKDLLKWPEFKQEAEGRGLGRAVEGDEARLRELAATLADLQVPADTARDAGQRLQAALREHPQAADADLESVLRRSMEAAADRVTGGKDTLVYFAGARPVPSLRSRLIVETYEQLLAARPELAGTESRAALQKLLTTRGDGESRAAGGWLQERGAAMAASVDEAAPGFLRGADAHLFYTESFRAAPRARDGFRSPDSAFTRLLFASLGSAAAALMAGAHQLWHPAGFWFWVVAALFGLGSLSALVSWPLWLSQRLRAGRGSARLDAALETRLAVSLRRGTPRAALDIVAELDAEREVWFPRPGHKKIFDRLAREWPEFRAAAGLDKK
jgi:hypothetical protein